MTNWLVTSRNSKRPYDFGPDDVDATDELPILGKPARAQLESYAQQMQADITHADAKASTLLGWSGTALAVVSTVIASLGVYVPPTHRWVALVGLAGLGGLAWSVAALILVIRPRLGGRLYGGYSFNPDERSFLTFASVPPSAIVSAACVDTYANADPTLAVHKVQVLASIALAKHRLIRSACIVLLLSMPLLALASAVMATSLPVGGA
jgi:hypothetical protein